MTVVNPKISVIMPSLNVAEFIEECIESVINQTLKDLEIICVDAGSNDGTLEILQNYANNDSRIKIIHSDVKSYGHQMNLGINEANGQYIAIVETDDYIDERMYETLYRLTHDGSVDISKGNFYHLYDDESDNVRARADDTKKNLPDEVFTIFDNAHILKGHPCIWAAIYRKKFLEENNIKFMEAPGGGWVDNPFLFRTFLSSSSIAYIDEPFYYYRELNPTSSTNNIKDVTLPMRRMENVLDIIDEFNISDRNILTELYVRVFHHVHETLEKYNIKNKEVDLYEYFSKVLRRLNKDLVDKKFKLKDKIVFYKYRSPMTLITKYDSSYVIKDSDLKYIYEENEFLYSQYDDLEDKNKRIKRKYNEVKNENKKLNKKSKTISNNIAAIEQSKAFKMSSKIASPIRKIKKVKHNSSKQLNILFLFSDNNKNSCNFLLGVSMIKSLRDKYSINPFVILPCNGDGDELLASLNINFKIIDSINWCISLSEIKYLDKLGKYQKDNSKSIKQIMKFIKENNINLIHINDSCTYVGAEAAISEKIPFVWHLRELLEEDKHSTLWDRKYGNKFINNSNKIFVSSNDIYDKYERILDEKKLINIFDKEDSCSKEQLINGDFEYPNLEKIFNIYNQII